MTELVWNSIDDQPAFVILTTQDSGLALTRSGNSTFLRASDGL